MFSFESLEKIQVEITNRCQAKCPMCLRNIHGGIENPLLKLNDWTIDQFSKIFNGEVLEKIKHVDFCGDFGDPIINNDLIDMCQYLNDAGKIAITIHTNGSARNKEWWQRLARSLPENHKVEFALDGLSKTHSLYRIGTSFENILNNSKSFIEAGGKAEWVFIKFKHNEHEVEDARELSKKLGFKSFVVKNSKRFGKKFPVVDSTGNITHYIEQPLSSNIKPVEYIDLKDYKQWNSTIDCFTLNDKELYIDAHGHVFPCCLIGSFIYANYDVELYKKYNLYDSTSVISIASEVKSQVFDIIKELGGLESLNTNNNSIKEIMSREVWQTLIKNKWKVNQSGACSILCGSNSPYISIDDQINRAS